MKSMNNSSQGELLKAMNKEQKRRNFERIATQRMNRILKDIESLKNLNNSSFYACDEKDYKKIVGALKNAVNDVEQYFFDNGFKEFKL